VFALVLALVNCPLLSSCADDSKPRDDNSSVPALDNLVLALQKAESDIAQGFLLNNATVRNKAELKENIYDLKVAAYRLKKDPDDRSGLTQLYLAFSTYDQIKLLKDDETLLGDLKTVLRLSLDALSQRQGVDLDGIERPLFEKSFDTELDPFLVFTAKSTSDGSWKQNGYKEKHYAQAGSVSKDGLESWLISPKLNLAETRNPKLVIDQAIKGDGFSNIVSVRVTTDTFTSDPNSVKWDTLKINKLPDGSSFTFVSSEKVDLKTYEGKTIILAFVYNTGKDLKSSVTWELGTVTVFGTGKLQQETLSLTSLRSQTTPPSREKASPRSGQ
ncbi:MAG: choice-of-anchor J domain-containing protein, partial [Proteobacteria bacterium]|nr:choice-of-anchor J domain-containing protein [Pseudomonadota bacterium]